MLAVNVGAATTGFRRATPQSRRHERCAWCTRGRVGLLRVPLTVSARPQRRRPSPYGLYSAGQRQIDGPELDEPRASSHIDDDDADEPRRLARTVADVLETTARCTLRRQRTAVEVAIRPNRATVRRQQRVVAAAAPTGDPAQVLETLDDARQALRDGAGGTDAFWVVRASGASDATTGVCTYQWLRCGGPALRQCLSVGGTDGARGQRESCDDGLSASDAA